MAAPAQVVGQPRGEEGERHQQRHERGRREQQHRHERELRGGGHPGADAEAHPLREGEDDDEHGHRRVERHLGVGAEEREREDRREQRGRGHDLGDALAAPERAHGARARLAKQRLDVGMGLDRGRLHRRDDRQRGVRPESGVAPDIRPTAVETLRFHADALQDVVMRTTGPIKEDP